MTSTSPPRSDRLVALVNYGLFIAAPFTLGVLAFAAVMIAYARRGRADPLTRGHYDHQIRAFWTDLIVVILGFVCGWAALGMGLGTMVAAMGVQTPGLAEGPMEAWTWALALAWALLWLRGLGGLMLGSAIGAIRLASGQPARKRRR